MKGLTKCCQKGGHLVKHWTFAVNDKKEVIGWAKRGSTGNSELGKKGQCGQASSSPIFSEYTPHVTLMLDMLIKRPFFSPPWMWWPLLNKLADLFLNDPPRFDTFVTVPNDPLFFSIFYTIICNFSFPATNNISNSEVICFGNFLFHSNFHLYLTYMGPTWTRLAQDRQTWQNHEEGYIQEWVDIAWITNNYNLIFGKSCTKSSPFYRFYPNGSHFTFMVFWTEWPTFFHVVYWLTPFFYVAYWMTGMVRS